MIIQEDFMFFHLQRYALSPVVKMLWTHEKLQRPLDSRTRTSTSLNARL